MGLSGRPPLSRHPNYHLDLNVPDARPVTHGAPVGRDARAPRVVHVVNPVFDVPNVNQANYHANYIMPHGQVGHAKVPNFKYRGSQPKFSKYIHNEQYFSRLARINPRQFAISGQGIKGSYVTPK